MVDYIITWVIQGLSSLVFYVRASIVAKHASPARIMSPPVDIFLPKYVILNILAV